jgi:hypothetical protein
MATPPLKLTFHVAVSATPTKIPHLLNVLQNADMTIFEGSVLDQMASEQSSDMNRFDEARILAEQQLGLIETTKEGMHITQRAEVLLTKRITVQYDLLHYLFYTTWRLEEPTKHARSWFYRTACDDLWNKQSIQLDLDARNALTEQLTRQALEDFQNVPGFSGEKISVGRQTLAGTLEWLRHLKPSVIEGEKVEEFHRRQACSAELFLLALSRSAQLSGSEVGMDLLLSPQRREEICRLCLLEPLQFDRMLDWMLPIFPQFVSQGTRSGSYGRFIRLNHLVQIEDFA